MKARDGDALLISVVVSSYRRAARLDALVASLNNQDLGGHYEILIVDNGSHDGTSAVLSRLSASSQVPLRPLRIETNSGAAPARNLGWRSARGSLIAFTDDDCSPQPGWLTALTRALAHSDFVQGRTQPDPSQRYLMNPFSRSIGISRESGFYETCNIAYRRELLERLGGFDESLRYAGDDTDLGCRARAAGVAFSFEENALVYHDVVRQSFLGFLRNKKRWVGVVETVHKRPELRRVFLRGPFWVRNHALAVTAALGLSLPLLPRNRALLGVVGLLSALPYVRYRLKAHPLPGSTPVRVPHLPLVFIGDLAEAATHVRSELRHRWNGRRKKSTRLPE